MIQILQEAWRLYREKKRNAAREKLFFDVALAFNRVHTYQGTNGKWMCPKCHRVHDSINAADPMSIYLTGRQYPACCDFPEGHRLNFAFAGYATDTDFKLP